MMGQLYDIRPRRVIRCPLCFLLAFFLLCSNESAWAQRPRKVIEDLIRGTSRVADDVPLGKVDELIEDVARSRAAREAVDAEIREASRAGRATGAGRNLPRGEEVLQLLRVATKDLDPSVIRRLEQLDEGSREAALVMARGGEHVQRSLPDLAARGRFLREGGAETVTTIGTFGPDAARAALRLDGAIQAGSLVVRDGTRAVSLADFGRVMTRGGDASWSFWRTYVQPHWKVWLASGALAAYLGDPEGFQDAAGRLTESGFRRLTELAGEVAAAAIRGTGRGAAESLDRVADAIGDTFWSGARSRSAFIGVALLLVSVCLSFRRVRSRILRALRMSPGSSKPTGSHEPKSAP
ncbi:MAG: hypothetical protein U0835_24095 [Isosphaeraceae bacterium]